jgi:hypothetical protein
MVDKLIISKQQPAFEALECVFLPHILVPDIWRNAVLNLF